MLLELTIRDTNNTCIDLLIFFDLFSNRFVHTFAVYIDIFLMQSILLYYLTHPFLLILVIKYSKPPAINYGGL